MAHHAISALWDSGSQPVVRGLLSGSFKRFQNGPKMIVIKFDLYFIYEMLTPSENMQ